MKLIDSIYRKCSSYYKKHQFVVKLMLVILISVAAFVFGMIQMGDSYSYVDYTGAAPEGKLTENIKSGQVIEQKFELLNNNVIGVSVCFATYESTVTAGNITASVTDSKGNIVSETELSATAIKDNSYLDILFESSDKLIMDETYTLNLFFQNIDHQSIACWLSPDDQLVMMEIETGRDLFSISYILVMTGFIVLVYAVYIMVYHFKESLWKIYIPVGLFLGLLYLMIIPVFGVPDEPSHLYSAYQVSNNIFGIDESEDGSIMMRRDDAESGLQHAGINRLYYDKYYAKITNFFVDNEEMVLTTNKTVPTYSYLYYACGLGMTIGRLLHLGTVPMYLLGALFNFLVFFAAVTYGIKKIPFGKMVVFLWAFLPMTLQQASSYSYDAIILALSVVVISLSLNLAYTAKEKCKKSEWIVLFICVMLLVPAKSFALLPLCMLPFLIYFKKYKESKKILYYTLGLIGGIILVVIGLKLIAILGGANVKEVTENGVATIYTGEQGFTVGYLLQHPKTLFCLLWNTVYYKGDFYFNTLLGNSLGWFEINIPLFSVLPYFVMLIIASMKKKQEPLYLSKRAKFYLCILAIAGIGFACAGMLLTWTPITNKWIEGVQGRYFLPFIILLFLSIRSNKIEVDTDVDKKITFSAVWLQMLIFLFIYLRAL